jgi:hypothetical protein
MTDLPPLEIRDPLLPVVRSSLAAASPGDFDQGAAGLAVRYAQLLDDAVVAAKYAKAMSTVGRFIDLNADNLPHTARQQLYDAWERITVALSEHTVASDLGPKLLAALTSLQLTPAARSQPAAPSGSKAPVIPIKDPLTSAREAAQQRWGNATPS